MVSNYFNNDEVFITEAGISIRKTDGTWENIPNFVAPRGSLTGNSANIRKAIMNNEGKLFFNHGNNWGLHYLDVNHKYVYNVIIRNRNRWN